VYKELEKDMEGRRSGLIEVWLWNFPLKAKEIFEKFQAG
jgi:hypothetical protein